VAGIRRIEKIRAERHLEGKRPFMSRTLGDRRRPPPAADDPLPFEASVGYQVRLTNRIISRYLQQRIAPYGVSLGMWYFLRALWHEDGLTQRELSAIVGTMEPTTLSAIRSMEASGLVRRVKNSEDRRKINIFLTDDGRALREVLLPIAISVVQDCVRGFSGEERAAFLHALKKIQFNLFERLDGDATEIGR
jgi:MarR family transcriptional regulator, organic hydroperoxide resistance regulator